ncbi:MAG: TetR/AcrR family transcriptional regulator [Anaerolineae bacterium]|nr:TetR/AcrR family transcriptional regulator [Anaerolineae bacterium]
MVRKLDPEKRETFLNTALNLFVTHGVQNTSTAKIAQEAGTAAGTLFIYFPTKQDLVNELILKLAREQSENTKAKLDPALSARDTFFTIWQSTIHWFLENLESYLYIQQVRDSTIIPDEVTQETETYFSYYYEAIQKGLAENSIKPYALELAGTFLYYDIMAVMSQLVVQTDESKQEGTIRIGFELFWDGIKS